jgi:threonine dehydrogenase-like Zn-dependent dehydrogenase
MLAVTFQKPFEVAVSRIEKPTIKEPTDAIVKVSLAGLFGIVFKSIVKTEGLPRL